LVLFVRGLGDVTTAWPQNLLVALDCQAPIAWARNEFQRIRKRSG
jgi:hypothetical protein